MKNLSRIFIMFMLIAIYHNAWASDGRKDDTPVINALQSGKKTKRLEGATLKIARPVMKNTPISVILDDIDMMARAACLAVSSVKRYRKECREAVAALQILSVISLEISASLQILLIS